MEDMTFVINAMTASDISLGTNFTVQEIIRYPGEITEPNINRLFH